jgi:hypothetical protein
MMFGEGSEPDSAKPTSRPHDTLCYTPKEAFSLTRILDSHSQIKSKRKHDCIKATAAGVPAQVLTTILDQHFAVALFDEDHELLSVEEESPSFRWFP